MGLFSNLWSYKNLLAKGDVKNDTPEPLVAIVSGKPHILRPGEDSKDVLKGLDVDAVIPWHAVETDGKLHSDTPVFKLNDLTSLSIQQQANTHDGLRYTHQDIISRMAGKFGPVPLQELVGEIPNVGITVPGYDEAQKALPSQPASEKRSSRG